MQNFHIPLAQINKELNKNTAENYLQEQLKTIKEEIKEKEKEYKFLEKIKDFLFRYDSKTTLSSSRKRGSGFPIRSGMTNGDVFQTKIFGPYNLFCTKVEHGEYAKITDYIRTLWKEAKRLKLRCKPSEITFYLNNAYNPKNTPLEIAFILKSTSEESLRNTSEVAKQRLRILRGGRPKDFLFQILSRNENFSF